MIPFMLGVFVGGVAAGVGALVAVWAVRRDQQKRLPPVAYKVNTGDGNAAIREMRRARAAGELNADEKIVVDRMERFAASRPRPEEP